MSLRTPWIAATSRTLTVGVARAGVRREMEVRTVASFILEEGARWPGLNVWIDMLGYLVVSGLSMRFI